MSIPSIDTKLRVLILDNKNNITQKIANVLGDGFELTRVNNFKEAGRMLSFNPLPWYSLIIFESSQLDAIDESNLEQKIERLRKEDEIVPHMVYGKNISCKSIVAACRGSHSTYSDLRKATNLYYVKDQDGLQEVTKLIFMPPLILPHLTLVKAGGSSFDYDSQIRKGNLEYFCMILSKLFEEDFTNDLENKRSIMVTAGAGQFGDISKNFYAAFGNKYPLVDKHFPLHIIINTHMNLVNLLSLFKEDSAFLVELGCFYDITKENSAEKIPLIAAAPHYIMARDGIPLKDSDTQTIALAEFYGAKRIILFKRTDGIYKFDLLRGFVLDKKTGKCVDYNAWRKVQEGNQRYGVLTVDELLEQISREGSKIEDGKADGSWGHLIEDSALKYFRDKCKIVEEILIVHIANEEIFTPIGKGYGKHIVTGQQIEMPDHISEDYNINLLEKNLRNAFEGISYSKIVRER